jgi:hypothetical protein
LQSLAEYRVPDVPKFMQGERVTALARHRYLVATSGARLVLAGADEEECRTFNDNAKAALDDASVAGILRVSVGARETVYVAAITSQDSNVVLRLTPDGKSDPGFRRLTSLPFSLRDRRSFLDDSNPYTVDRAKIQTMRELADGRVILFGWAHSVFMLNHDGTLDQAYLRQVTTATAKYRASLWVGYHVLGVDSTGAVLAVRATDPRELAAEDTRSSVTLFVIRPDGTILPSGVVSF